MSAACLEKAAGTETVDSAWGKSPVQQDRKNVTFGKDAP